MVYYSRPRIAPAIAGDCYILVVLIIIIFIFFPIVDTVRLITGTRRRDHVTPVLRELHWLPIRERIKFKVACLVRQSLS